VGGPGRPSEAAPKYGTFAEIEGVIMEFDKIDPQSFAFRYPIDKRGDPPLPEHFHFNVVKLGEEMDQPLRMLDGAATGVYEQFQFLAREVPQHAVTSTSGAVVCVMGDST
jgi:hypothetical protein